jgi:dienelactone hydrolase
MRPIELTALALAAWLVAPSALADLSAPGAFKAGTASVTVTRPDGSTFAATLHYPATLEAVNAPLDGSGAPYPGIVFGHGFVQPVTQYASTLKHLATHGFFVIASQSEGGLFPNHANFAKDLRASIDWLEAQNSLLSSPYLGAIDVDRLGASGHSMGGGASILATKDDFRIDALATLAAADTNPSSIAAMSAIGVPVRLIAGSDDTIVPPDSSTVPMFGNADAPRQMLTIEGGFHCGFTDASFLFCDSGGITRAEQLAITRRLLTEFFLLHLRGEQSWWSTVWGPATPPSSETLLVSDPGATIAIDPDVLSSVPGVRSSAIVTVTNTGPLPTSFTLLSEPAEGWSLSFSPASTPVLANGESAITTLTAVPSGAADTVDAIVSARRDIDESTRAWTTLELAPAIPTPDFNDDGVVDGADLGVLLAAWGPGPSPADLNEDGVVDGADLGMLLAAW